MKQVLLNMGVTTLTTGFIYFIMQKYFGSIIESTFARSLEKYKHQLSILTETIKFDSQKKFYNFNLYAEKKHSIYSEMNKVILIAEASVCGLYGLTTESIYEEYNRNDIKAIMESEIFPDGKIQEILGIWDNCGREDAIKRMKQFLRVIQFNKAKSASDEARNLYFLNKFYFSENIDGILKDLCDNIAILYNCYSYMASLPTCEIDEKKTFFQQSKECKDIIKTLLPKLFDEMKKELSIGYDFITS